MAPSDPPRPPPPLPSVCLETSRARLLAQRTTSLTHSLPPAPPKPLPSLLQRLPASVQPSLQTTLSKLSALASSRQGTNPSFRVGQLDAELLDEELLTLLTTQVGDSLKYFGRHISTDWKSEIHLVLRSILFKLSIWDHDASYGASLQGLRYIDGRGSSGLTPPSRWQKGIYGLVSVLGTYGFAKWEDWLINVEAEEGEPPAWVPRAENLTRWASNVHAVAATVSFCVFLVNGRYRTLLDRVLGMKLAAPSAQIAREVSFEYLNRQLVWHAFTEFLLFFLPLMGVAKWRKWLSRGWRRTKKFVKQASRDGNDVDDDEEMKGELHHLPERTCAICYAEMNPSTTSEAELMALGGMSGGGGVVGDVTTDVTNPYETLECGHVYCYVCISKRIEAEGGDGWQCLRCGETVMRARPWNGDVILPVVEEEEIGTANANGNANGEDGSEKNKVVKSVRFGDEDDEDNEAHEGGEVGMRKTRTLDLGPAGAEESLLDDEKMNGDESMYFSGISSEDTVERIDEDEKKDDGSSDLFA